MSGPNGDLNITIDDGIIADDDEFDEEGRTLSFCFFSRSSRGISCDEIILENQTFNSSVPVG